MRYRFEHFTLDDESGSLRGPEGEVKLRPQAFQLLLYLVRNHSRILPRDELLDRVWGTDHVSVNSLPQVISELRQALDDKARRPRYIETIHRRGYRFNPPPKTDPPEADPPKSDPLMTGPTATSAVPVAADPMPSGARWKPRTARWPVGWAALCLLLVFATALPTSSRWRDDRDGSSAIRSDRGLRRLAVLDLRNVSDDPARAWLTVGLADMLAAELARSDEISVISGERVSRMRNDLGFAETDTLGPSALNRLGRHLGADLVMLGSFAPAGSELGELRLKLRVVETETHATVAEWSGTRREAEWTDLVIETGAVLRRRLGLAVPDALSASAVHARPPAAGPAAPFYFDAMKALWHFDPLTSRALLEEAARHDPTSADIYHALTRTFLELGDEGRALESARRALEVAGPLEPEKRLLMEGQLHELEGRPAEAVAIYRELFENRVENLNDGLRLASALIAAGQGRDALLHLERLREGLGTSPEMNHTADRARIDLLMAQAARALSELTFQAEAARRAAEGGERIGAATLVGRAYLLEGEALERLGEVRQAQERMDQAYWLLKKYGDHLSATRALGAYGQSLFKSGELGEGREQVEHALALAEEIGHRRLAAEQKSRLGELALYRGRWQDAHRLLREALASYSKARDRSGMAATRLKLANAVARRGDLEEARELITAARQTYQEAGDRHGEAEAWDQLGSMIGRAGNMEEAERAFERALELYRETGDRRGEGETLGHLASIRINEGRLNEAGRLLSQALELSRQTSNRRCAAKVMYNLGVVYLKIGRLNEAHGLLEESLSAFLEIGEELNAAWVLRKLGDVQARQGRLGAARETLGEALARSREVGSRGAEGHALSSLGDLAWREGNREAAVNLHREARALRLELGQSGNAAVDEFALARLALERGHLEEAEGLAHVASRSILLNSPGWQAFFLAFRARLELARGRIGSSEASLEEAESSATQSEDVSLNLAFALERSKALLTAGHTELARESFSELIREADERGFAALASEARQRAEKVLLR